MPNWCENDVAVLMPTADEMNKLREEVRGSDQSHLFDFDKLIPMPSAIRETESGSAEIGFKILLEKWGAGVPWLEEIKVSPERLLEVKEVLQAVWPNLPEESILRFAKYCGYPKVDLDSEIATAKAYHSNRQEYGHHNWYEWAVKNWGTKWNTGGVKVTVKSPLLVIFHFDTAWSPPTPVIFALAEKYPTARIIHKYYEAGAGYKGTDKYRRGKRVSSNQGDYQGRRGG